MENMLPINVNGYETYYTEAKDYVGSHMLIAVPQTAGKNISNICGDFINGHWITQIDYKLVNGTRFIKAYY